MSLGHTCRPARVRCYIPLSINHKTVCMLGASMFVPQDQSFTCSNRKTTDSHAVTNSHCSIRCIAWRLLLAPGAGCCVSHADAMPSLYQCHCLTFSMHEGPTGCEGYSLNKTLRLRGATSPHFTFPHFHISRFPTFHTCRMQCSCGR